MSDDYDCNGTSSQQHCGSERGVAACNSQGQSEALESTWTVFVVEEVMAKVKILSAPQCWIGRSGASFGRHLVG